MAHLQEATAVAVDSGTAPEPRPPVVLREAREIQDMRDALRAAMKRVNDAATSNEPAQADMWDVRRRALNHGRLVEAIDVAEAALFNVLNTAASYCKCFAANHVLEGSHGLLDDEQRANGDALILATVGLIDREGQVT